MMDQGHPEIASVQPLLGIDKRGYRTNWSSLGAGVLLVALSLVPVYNIVHILATSGANNLSNDYALFLPLIDKILSGGYAWTSFFQDTFFVSHFQPLPILVYLANALLTGWNVYAELFFIVLLTLIRLVLTFQAFTSLAPLKQRLILLPILSALIFSTSQMSSFEFGASAVPLGLTAFGFTLGVWGIVRYREKPLSFIFMVAGGLIASWTAATGLIAWVIFLAGMTLLGFRKALHYLAWVVAAFLVNFPYIYFLVLHRQPGTNALFNSLLDLRLIVNLLGRPFANGINASTGFLPLGEAAGWLGLLLGILGLVLVIVRRKQLMMAAAAPIMFMAFGLASTWQTSVFRIQIAPWYTNVVMPYWVGLAGLAVLLLSASRQPGEADSTSITGRNWLSSVYALSALVILAGFYLVTNLTYRDKSFYMVSRSPASAACLRNYTWAPTYCERRLFQWTPNRVYLQDFAWPLQRHQLSVFADDQLWTMQGDVVLGSVASPEDPNSPGAEWVDGLPGAPAAYTDYRHLNLRITPTHSSTWTVSLPEDLAKAELVTAFGRPKGADSPVKFEIYLSINGQPEQLLTAQVLEKGESGWSKFNLSLLSYAGKSVKLHFSIMGAAGTTGYYRFPSIQLIYQSRSTLESEPKVAPLNTELSARAPADTPEDVVFNLEQAEQTAMVAQLAAPATWRVQSHPYFSLPLARSLSLHDYGWISFRLAASQDIISRAAQVRLIFDDQANPIDLVIPLLPDGGTHTYTYPLRMVEVNGRLTALRFYPIWLASAAGQNIITIEDVRLIHLP